MPKIESINNDEDIKNAILQAFSTIDKLNTFHEYTDKLVHIWYKGYACEYVDDNTLSRFKGDNFSIDQYLMDKYNLSLVHAYKYMIDDCVFADR